MRRDLYIVLNRLVHEFADCGGYLPDDAGRLAYVATARSAAALSAGEAAAIEVVEDLSYAEAADAVGRLILRYGKPTDIVALSDYDVLTAAMLRDAFEVKGGYSSDLILRFKDKPLMKEILSRAGLRVPRYMCLDELHEGAIEQVNSLIGLPLIVKPRRGVASHGVQRIDNLTELHSALACVPLSDYECEEYVEGSILHVDGIRRGSEEVFTSVSEYVNTCLDFANGSALGSVLIDDEIRRREVVHFASDCIDALSLTDGVFHLEVIQEPNGDLCFLEVGLRPGGAQVAFIHRDLFGVELFGEAFRASIGLPIMAKEKVSPGSAAGGWLLMPEPETPSRLLEATSLMGEIPEIYFEILPKPGTEFHGDGGYDNPGGIFRLRGATTDKVCLAIESIMQRYELAVEPLHL